MDWIVKDKEQFEQRQYYIMDIINEKRKQKEQLEFEINSLVFLHMYMNKENKW